MKKWFAGFGECLVCRSRDKKPVDPEVDDDDDDDVVVLGRVRDMPRMPVSPYPLPNIVQYKNETPSMMQINDVVSKLSHQNSVGRYRSQSLVGEAGVTECDDVMCWGIRTSDQTNLSSKESTPIHQLKIEKPDEFARCIEAFNLEATKGLKMFAQFGFISKSATDVSTLLYECSGLNRSQVGKCLARRDKFGIYLRREFISKFDFSNLDIDDALRVLLCGFKLPPEAQIIDRIIEQFASQYVLCNPELHLKIGDVYVLAFAIVMLNTDLHNPHVKYKMTKSQFVKNVGSVAPPEFLEQVYARVLETPIRLTDNQVRMTSFCCPAKQGWVMYTTHKGMGMSLFASWQRRWCIIKDTCLFFFMDPQDAHPVMIVPLDHLMAVDWENKKNKPNSDIDDNNNDGTNSSKKKKKSKKNSNSNNDDGKAQNSNNNSKNNDIKSISNNSNISEVTANANNNSKTKLDKNKNSTNNSISDNSKTNKKNTTPDQHTIVVSHSSGSFKSNQSRDTGQLVVRVHSHLCIRIDSYRNAESWLLKIRNAILLRKRALSMQQTRNQSLSLQQLDSV
eukprot:c11937_g1_i4.p1 GENE.c11937_g1_i4~~c11937_g1_i4.p1  ORF type:complete len:562 (+),score=178.28 c11937_g1_i4:760-2445(+)